MDYLEDYDYFFDSMTDEEFEELEKELDHLDISGEFTDFYGEEE